MGNMEVHVLDNPTEVACTVCVLFLHTHCMKQYFAVQQSNVKRDWTLHLLVDQNFLMRKHLFAILPYKYWLNVKFRGEGEGVWYDLSEPIQLQHSKLTIDTCCLLKVLEKDKMVSLFLGWQRKL